MKISCELWGLPPGLQAFLAAVTIFTSSLHTALSQPSRLGDLDADVRPTVIDLQLLINHINGSNPLSSALLPYGDLNEDGLIDQSDILLLQNAILGLAPLPNPYSAPVVNAPVIATNGSSLAITGVARPNRTIYVHGGAGVFQAIADSNGLFSVSVVLQSNRMNNLFLTASNGSFTAGIPQPLKVLQDSEPPWLYIDFPTNNQTFHASNTVIAGRVGDRLSGFMGLNVWVHSSPSEGASPGLPLPGGEGSGVRANVNVGIGNNGTFERSIVPLAEGTNLITVTTSDRYGNSVARQVTVNYQPLALDQPRLVAVSGDMQMTNVHRRLAQPIAVRVLQGNGAPFANELVDFEITRSDGRLLPVDPNAAANLSAFTNDITRTVHGVMHLQLFTDANGEASAWWALGGDAGCGNNRLCVMSAGISNTLYFCASAKPAAVRQINIGTGNNQKAEVGAFIADPLRAWVSDSCNGNEGLPVTFTIVQGGGKLFPSPTGEGGSTSLTILSSITGHAEVRFQLGPDAGQNTIEATYPGNAMPPATFIAYGVARDPAKPTTFTGLILDNTSQPIGGAWCRLFYPGPQGNAPLFSTYSDAQGRFIFTNALPGRADLNILGNYATTLGTNSLPFGSFPALSFSTTLIPNAENSLPAPVLLPRLNTNNVRSYYGTNDFVLTCEGIEGLKMTIKANSMRLPNGTVVSPETPVNVSLNQVHHDNVPMPIPDGASPPFAWTLQPGGSTFDPPIQIEYPNMSGLAAGTVAYFLSYNHETERFEIVASGHVRSDSTCIVTDPGAGLSVAGWGCNCPPYAVAGRCCHVQSGAPPAPSASPTPDLGAAGVADPVQITQTPDSFFDVHGTTLQEAVDYMSSHQPLCGTVSSAGCTSWSFTISSYRYRGQRTEIAVDESVCCDQTQFSQRLNIDEAIITMSINIRLPNWVEKNTATCRAQREWDRFIGLLRTHEQGHVAIAMAGANELEQEALGLESVKTACDPNNALSLAKNALSQKVSSAISHKDSDLKRRSAAYDTPPFFVPINTTEEGDCPPGFVQQSPFAPAIGVAQPQIVKVPAPEVLDREDYLDGTWVMSVAGQSVNPSDGGDFFLPNISAGDQFGPGGPGTGPDFLSDDFLRLTGTSTKNGVTRYVFSEFFQIRQGETRSITDLTFADIPPRKTDSLTILPETRVMTNRGQTNQLHVTARYADGTTNDVTARAWTTYRISNPNIAMVAPDGGVIPKARGIVFVTAVNEGASAVIQLDVSPDDTLTSVAGTVVNTNGLPVAGATVRLDGLALPPVTTGPEGQFTVTGVPTGFGALAIQVIWTTNGVTYFASLRLNPVAGGETMAGTLALHPLNISTTALAAGNEHTVALQTDGTLWAWGGNQYGQLGDGTFARANTPQPIGTNASWKAVAAGYVHTVAFRADGSLWAWGANLAGQLGNGTLTGAGTPQPIGTNASWKAVAAGAAHTVALQADGTLWTWGVNSYGQLGNGTLINTNTPQRIGTNATWRAVTAGYYHTVALRADGSLWAWGRNDSGQLGNGSVSMNSPYGFTTPQRIGTNTNWRAVAAADTHTVALRADGSLWAWGRNVEGQLGIGTLLIAPTPQLVGTNATWQAVAAGGAIFYGYSSGLRADGSLWAWGENGNGQLGNGTSISTNTPQPIVLDVTWEAVATGGGHAVALRADGTLWAWGNDESGQLGDGNYYFGRNSPLQVGTNATWGPPRP